MTVHAASLSDRKSLVLADLVPGALVRDALLVAGGAGLTGLLAQVAFPVPGSPVPVTGQTFGALIVGAALGWRRGIASLALYLVAGVMGVPWFSEHSSGYASASFGYIIGFVAAAGIVGALAGRGGDRNPVRTVGTMVVGNLVIYAFGLSWLMADLRIGLGKAVSIGLTNYLPGDAIKIALAAGLLPAAWKLAKR